MNPLSSTNAAQKTSSSTSFSSPLLESESRSFYNDTQENASLYDSAFDTFSASNSFHVSANTRNLNTSTESDKTYNGNDLNMSNINASMLLIQSESTETNTSQEEVDPKSQLANKTIFKTDNPNLSIIEISNNSIKEQELENSVVLIESLSEEEDEAQNEKEAQKKQNHSFKQPQDGARSKDDNISDKRRKRAEWLLHSKQKLNSDLLPPADDSESPVGGIGDADRSELNAPALACEHPETKREIKIYDNLEEFDQNLPSTVTVLDTPFGSKVYLVGTAHFSEESQDDVSYVIRNVRPDIVMVELCPSRIHILKLDEKTLLEEAKNFNLAKIRSIIQAHGYINGIFFILLLQMSAQIAKDLGMAPGGEFRRAFEEIHKLPNCVLHLGDRPIRVTLHRALRALSLWQTVKLVWRLTSSDTISIEEVEECKQRDLLEKLMQEMTGEFPAFSDVFVKERDLFLCHSLQLAALPQTLSGSKSLPHPVRVVGVVGIGHANGIAQMWGHVDPQSIPAIMEIPPASTSTRVCKYTIKYGLIGLTLFGAFKILRPRISRLF